MPKILVVIMLFVFPAAVLALPQEKCGETRRDCAACHSLSIRDASALLQGTAEVKAVKISSVAGLYELTIESMGKHGVAYVDFGKKHIVSGPIFDIATKKPVGENSSAKREDLLTVDINSIPVENSILIGNPEGKKKLFVFTDPECPFCEKLHRELVKLTYMEPDAAIYVKMYPLKMHPGAYDKARVILGSNSPYLLDKSFAGELLPAPGPKDLAKPVEETIRLAESLGITATPTLVLPDGRILPGYKDAAVIKGLLKVN